MQKYPTQQLLHILPSILRNLSIISAFYYAKRALGGPGKRPLKGWLHLELVSNLRSGG